MRSILLVAATLSVLVLWLLPKLQVRKLSIEPKEKFSSENEARKTVAQILSGLFFFGTLYFTWQSYELSKQQTISARFAKAIEQLAHQSYEIRLGSIYSLESISRDSPDHYWQAMEVLTAYVRSRSHWSGNDLPRGPDGQCVRKGNPATTLDDIIDGACTCDAKDNAYLTLKSKASQPVSPDIQAVLSVLGRRKREYEQDWQRLDLRNTDLRGADLKKLHLERALFAGANVSDADFRGAFLSEVDLSNALAYETLFGAAQLQRAELNEIFGTKANFYKADLSAANLSGACLDRSEMGEALLFRAKLDSAVMLRGAKLWDANMKEIKTEFVNLEGADLTRADFTGADMAGIYFLTCEQIKAAKAELARRQPTYPACK